MRQLARKTFRLRPAETLERIIRRFSPAEGLLFSALFLILAAGSAGLLMNINRLFLTEVPARGGVLTEGIIGSPRFINPLLALSDADRDLSALVYSGLLKATPNGALIPDLAESYTISPAGLEYTFRLRPEARFHDGKPVTADDVVFTIQKAQDPALKSPKRANWEGVAVEKLGEREVKLTLKQPYAPFLENATLGILPRHIWKDTDAEQFAFSPRNNESVGSGPYAISAIKRNGSGIPFFYELTAFPHYLLGEPYLSVLRFKFYPNEKELLNAEKRGEIDGASGLTPQMAEEMGKNGTRIARAELPRIFAVFFNQNQAPLLAEREMREALDLAIDKDEMVRTVLQGYGVTIGGPIPYLKTAPGAESAAASTSARTARANALLDAAKWKRNGETGLRERARGKTKETAALTLATSNVPELVRSAELIAEMWREIGINATVQVFESGDLNQNIIRPRKYDALLFGEVIGRDLDLFAFWHSSQRNDPGLNIAMYTNAKVDKSLEDIRRTTDKEKREESYRMVISEIQKDRPAIFLYAPEFIYALPQKVKGVAINRLTVPSERFLEVHRWYINTERLWKIFRRSDSPR